MRTETNISTQSIQFDDQMTQDLKNQQPNNPTTQKHSNPKMTGHPNKLFVGGLSANTNDDGLRQHFERFGELIDHVVIKHKVQTHSSGFAQT
uniref:RRM domain-containing protein n=1 Tax=Oryzias melastigma TaxID=30732 RepID=A0A3B3DVC7_ORYME